jgi:hypothetical protein
MKYRLATILDRENHTVDTTKVIDLNLADPVSQMVIIYEPMNGNQSHGDGHPAKCITKIELVDGSDVLFSLTGLEAQAIDWYHNKVEPANILWYLNDNASEMVYNLNFGRYLWDPVYAFDPKKFTNPQLKITIDIDAGGSLADAGNLTVLANIFDQKEVSTEGFLMHKEIKDYTLASAAHEYTDLPTDHIYRKLFARIQKYGTGPEYCFDKIKLSEDNDRRVPINHSFSEILRAIMGGTRPYREWIIGPGTTTAQKFYCTPCYWPAFGAAQWRSAVADCQIAIYAGDGGEFSESQGAAGPNWQTLVEGWCPHGMIEIPFGIQDDSGDWYDATKLGSLRLDILSKSGMSSSESCQVCLQQLRKYAG